MLVFGEDHHDREAIIHLVRGLRQDLSAQVEERRRPLVLQKGSLPQRARENAEEIAKLVKLDASTRGVLAVLAHEDCDAVEPCSEAIAEKIERGLTSAGCAGEVVGVAPAWEIEAWWMLFPEAVSGVVEEWPSPDDWLGRDVGMVKDAKESLARALRTRDKKKPCRPYEEKDSIAIAKNIVSGALLGSFADGVRTTSGKGVAQVRTKSASFERFRTRVLAIGKRKAGVPTA